MKVILGIFVLTVTDFPASVLAKPLKDLKDDMGSRSYGLCEGDCDVDSDCKVGFDTYDMRQK